MTHSTRILPLAPDLWEVRHDVYMPGRIHFPGRMTVLRLPGGGLVLHSPVPVDDALAAELADLGPVQDIVAPCLFHHLFAARAAERYPDARLLAGPGMAAKRPDLPLDGTLPADAPAGWAGVLQAHHVAGIPALEEVVLHHAPSGTLIVTDLVFHLHEVANWQTRLLLRLVGAWQRLAMSRSLRLMTRDRAALADSAATLLALDFDRLVMAHGEILPTGGKAALADALGGVLPRPLLAAG